MRVNSHYVCYPSLNIFLLEVLLSSAIPNEPGSHEPFDGKVLCKEPKRMSEDAWDPTDNSPAPDVPEVRVDAADAKMR